MAVQAVVGQEQAAAQAADGILVHTALARLRADSSVLYAEPNYILTAAAVPNDPRFAELYGLDNTGQTGGTPDADIDAPEAWDIQTGTDVVVAVIRPRLQPRGYRWQRVDQPGRDRQ